VFVVVVVPTCFCRELPVLSCFFRSVERANQDVERMLASWMTDNKSTNWSIGLKFVQFMKNRAHHAGINMTPYKAMFGVDPRVGLVTSNLPNDLIATINVEDELKNLIYVLKLEVKIRLSRKLQVNIFIIFLKIILS